ncbi:acetylcholine receptor subunit beta-like 1 [Convolutriloba macropyga]|uniref:acetylcholine receptor subunit beta-like 1 n=1 Tax=Convolutriloba macropyga TaxID=536237 RepID=UPI003F521AFA
MRVWFLISYEVPELQWDPNSTNGIKMLYLPPRSFWTPDIVLLEVSGVDYDAYEDQFITADGLVIARSTTATLKISCQLSFLYFPFDQQQCDVTAGQWISTSDSYTIRGPNGQSGEITHQPWRQKGQWELLLPATFKVEPMRDWEDYRDLFLLLFSYHILYSYISEAYFTKISF